MKEDIVNPKRYTQNRLQCWDFWIKAGLDPLIACAVKYVWRYKYKNGIDDLLKAKVFLDKAISTFNETNDLHFSGKFYLLSPSEVEDLSEKQFMFMQKATHTTKLENYLYYCASMQYLLDELIDDERIKESKLSD